MVVLLDLDEDAVDPHPDFRHGGGFADFPFHLRNGAVTKNGRTGIPEDGEGSERENPNINGFSAALGCYPIISQLTCSLDLNDLDALSRTCRQFRANLFPFRSQLVKQTLRCGNEDASSNAPRRAASNGTRRLSGTNGIDYGRMTSGRVGACARDMVAECRRCGSVVCRASPRPIPTKPQFLSPLAKKTPTNASRRPSQNCIIKPPSASTLPNRHRRLCTTCLSLPLATHTQPAAPAHLPPPSPPPPPPAPPPPTFTTPAFARTPCTCAHTVWLCIPCGAALRSADTTYKRVWTWRTRYSTNLGGLGTGIGEGNEGVQCGRGEGCFAAKYTEVESESGGVEDVHGEGLHPVMVAHPLREGWGERSRDDDEAVVPAAGKVDEHAGDGGGAEKAGYWRQEIEGIGGVVKRKVKRRVKVGRAVREYEDERECAGYLEREGRGEERSWCGWCWRVVPGVRDLDSDSGGRDGR